MTVLRRPGTVSITVLVGLCASLAAAHAIAPEWSRRTGLDVWNYPSVAEQLRRSAERGAEIEDHAEQCARRREAANHIAAKLGEGMPLAAAADEIMELFQNDTAVITTLKNHHRAAPSRRHLFARHAIDRFKCVMFDTPERYEAILPRLEAEYRQLDAEPESPRTMMQ